MGLRSWCGRGGEWWRKGRGSCGGVGDGEAGWGGAGRKCKKTKNEKHTNALNFNGNRRLSFPDRNHSRDQKSPGWRRLRPRSMSVCIHNMTQNPSTGTYQDVSIILSPHINTLQRLKQSRLDRDRLFFGARFLSFMYVTCLRVADFLFCVAGGNWFGIIEWNARVIRDLWTNKYRLWRPATSSKVDDNLCWPMVEWLSVMCNCRIVLDDMFGPPWNYQHVLEPWTMTEWQ